ncbi:MAG: hypothetical protein HY225_02420 [Candidatus Vogelbacteria bacterium]|nr:hypothetical protein [Candidatus Vogelbacteria bacterium]
MKYKIGIVGVGMVGEQVRRWFELKKYDVVAYDKFKGIGIAEDLDSANLIFLCLPSAYSKKVKTGVDTSIFEDFIKRFDEPKLFVIKSTVPPGTSDDLQQKFPQHKFFHSPEFLTEVTAWEDFSKPYLQLLGFSDNNMKQAQEIIKLLPNGNTNKVLSAVATEAFKYVRNSFFALKVTFANQVYDLCGALGINYDDFKDMMSVDPWIGANHLNVIHKGYRGFGGKCLAKDLKTFIKVYKSNKVKPVLFGAIDKINDKLLNDQKLTETLNKYWLNNSIPQPASKTKRR